MKEPDMTAPHASQYRNLNPRDGLGWLHTGLNAGLIGGGVGLSALASHPVYYIVGQLMLALGFTQAFVILHEAGHLTMFRDRRINHLLGWVAGFVSLIPYSTWRVIHNRHHRFTGWQDLDATTESLTPRKLSFAETAVINIAWRFWLPLFSIIYRVQNYWRIGRIKPFLPPSANQRYLHLSAVVQLFAYAGLIAWFGPGLLIYLIGPGLFLSFMAQDLLILSQHTGMPTNLSHDHPVDPFPPSQQEEFTRSIRLPRWLSWLLLHFDAHELHHLYPAVPGYLLNKIDYSPPNEVKMWEWVLSVKKLSGAQFLFGGPDVVAAE